MDEFHRILLYGILWDIRRRGEGGKENSIPFRHVSMTIKQKKDAFIESIDDALIDETANLNLITHLNPSKELLKK
ncbi:MAG: hypothetical protein ABSG49_05575 [Methanoregula sp.]|uniref:hypothetical protein n=1 Tax=Methanoregula sp. TaxID=2052170 RepID=UPI003C27C23E